MTIKRKLQLVALMAFVSLAAMAGLLLYAFSTITNLEEAKVLSKAVETDMLMLRRNEKDFLARLDLKYQEKFENNYARVQGDLGELDGRLAREGLDRASVTAVGEVLQEYRKVFLELIALQQQIGLDHESGLRGSLRKAVHEAEAQIKALGDYELLADMLMLRRNEKDFMLRLDGKYLDKFNKNFTVLMDDLGSRAYSAEQSAAISGAMQRYRDGFTAMVEGYRSKGLDSKSGLHGKMRDIVHQSEEQLAKMVTLIDNEVGVQIRSLSGITLGGALLLAVVIIGTILLLARDLSGRLNRTVWVMGQIRRNADLKLRMTVKGTDELAQLGRDFNAMMDEFRKIIAEVNGSSEQVSAAADELAAVTEQTRIGMLNQQGETEQVATALNEMSATVEEVARSTEDAAHSAEEASQHSNRGQLVVHGAVDAIGQLAGEVDRAAVVMGKLETEAEGIGTILDVIRGIAEQTNLLALNAAIEAARAGEQGRGFAVVADEVRTLAQRTQESTQQIDEMIQRLQGEAREAATVMAQGRGQSEESVRQANEALAMLTEIAQAVSTISDKNTHIASAAEEQRAVTEEVNRNLLSIKSVTDETTQSVEGMAASSDELAAIVHRLRDSVQRFKV